MQLFGLFAVTAYCAVALIVGARLLRLARRTRELPELFIGAAFLLGAMIGYPALVASRILAAGSPMPARAMLVLGLSGLASSSVCLLLTCWRIYHPTRRWAPWVVSIWTALLAVLLVIRVFRPVPGAAPVSDPSYLLMLIAQGGVYAANAWSALRYHWQLRIRLRLGLADPVVANRMLLWGLSAAAVTAQYSYALAVPLLNRPIDAAAVQPAVTGALGLFAAVAIALAFFPPHAYLRALERRDAISTS
jgi:hypothetical protein